MDREPSYGGRAYLEKQDYILMKQKEKLSALEQQIEQKESELEDLSIRIDDVEITCLGMMDGKWLVVHPLTKVMVHPKA